MLDVRSNMLGTVSWFRPRAAHSQLWRLFILAFYVAFGQCGCRRDVYVLFVLRAARFLEVLRVSAGAIYWNRIYWQYFATVICKFSVTRDLLIWWFHAPTIVMKVLLAPCSIADVMFVVSRLICSSFVIHGQSMMLNEICSKNDSWKWWLVWTEIIPTLICMSIQIIISYMISKWQCEIRLA